LLITIIQETNHVEPTSIVRSRCFARCLLGTPAIAQNFPNRAVTMVVPFPAGGITDAVARALASKMGEQLGKPVIVDNRPAVAARLRRPMCASKRPTAIPCMSVPPRCLPSTPRCFAISPMTR
jgi:hypothetical protein